MKIGFIGLGHMGAGMAARLLEAGHELTVFNRSPEKAQPLVGMGAKQAKSVAEACHGDAVITMLADDAAVESVSFGDAGIIRALPRGAVHISSSTISMRLVTRLSEAHAQAERAFAAAPVFGRPEAARAGQLFILSAGDDASLTRMQPLFDAMGKRTFRISDDPRAAALTKLGGNFLVAATIDALGEAMALAEKGGIDPQAFLDVLTSSLFDAPLYRNYGNIIAERRFEPAGFAAVLGFKDIGLALAAGDELRVPMPLAGLLRERFLTLLSHGGERLDWSAICRLPADQAGIGAA